MKEIPDERLRVYIIWVPRYGSDNREDAVRRSGEFSDKRITYFWDRELLSSKLWQKTLKLSKPAWDVYMLHGPKAKWGKEPDFWMHQLGEVDLKKASFLDGEELEVKIRELLQSVNTE